MNAWYWIALIAVSLGSFVLGYMVGAWWTTLMHEANSEDKDSQ